MLGFNLFKLMETSLLVILFITCIIIVNSQQFCYKPTNVCFDPASTKSIIFQANTYSTCSRVSPILQLNCVEGSNLISRGLCKLYENTITNMMCTNSGIDERGEVIWHCESPIPSGVLLGVTTVSCEGCTNSTSKLKITGSCAVFYQLVKNNPTATTTTQQNTFKENSSDTFIIVLLFCICLSLILGCVWTSYYHQEIINYYGPRTNRQDYIEITPLVSASTVPSAPPANTRYENVHIIQSTPRFVQPTRPAPRNNLDMVNGYLTARNLENGNYGSALLTSSISSDTSNYNTGFMLGMMSDNHKHHHKHHKHHNHHNYSSGYQSDIEQPSYSTSETYADTTTR